MLFFYLLLTDNHNWTHLKSWIEVTSIELTCFNWKALFQLNSTFKFDTTAFLIIQSLNFQELEAKLKPGTDASKPWLLDLMLVFSLWLNKFKENTKWSWNRNWKIDTRRTISKEAQRKWTGVQISKRHC